MASRTIAASSAVRRSRAEVSTPDPPNPVSAAPVRGHPLVPKFKIRPGTLALLALVAGIVAFAAIGSILAAGVFTRSAEPEPPARIGETIQIPGGLLRVDGIKPEVMNHNMMQMSTTMGMDMAPEGYRRFTVSVSLIGQARSGLHYAADQFRISGDGVDKPTAIRYALGNGVVPVGSAMSGTLLFQVPDTSQHLLLTYGDGNQAIALDLAESGPGHDHSPDASAGSNPHAGHGGTKDSGHEH